jgi:hypothetical protein
VPFNGNTSQEWIAWLAGANGGRVYASRSSNGLPPADPRLRLGDRRVPVELAGEHAGLRATTESCSRPTATCSSATSPTSWRIESTDGHTLWVHPRPRSVSGNCGVAGDGVGGLHRRSRPGGQVITKLDIATGGSSTRAR